MQNTLYYGEMVAKISARLHQNPDHIARINRMINKEKNINDSIWTVCADAAKVFDSIEDLSGEHFIDWHKAIDRYAQEVLDFLLIGRKLHVVDMVSMVARSIEDSR